MPDCNLHESGAQNGRVRRRSTRRSDRSTSPPRYDSSITSGFGVRPNDQEVAAGFQQQLLPRVAVDFQFTRHSFGNFVAAQNTGAAAGDELQLRICVTAPSDPRLPGGGGNQICGFMDQNPSTFTTSPFYVIQPASNFGDVSDVYTGYDVNANARLPRGGFVSGGASIGHEVTDICRGRSVRPRSRTRRSPACWRRRPARC